LLGIALVLTAIMLGMALALCVWRLWRGPTIPDRILALDTLYINAVALIVIYDIYAGTTLYFEAALVIALLGFVSTSAFCKHLLRGDIIE